jgi:hypothetical protein
MIFEQCSVINRVMYVYTTMNCNEATYLGYMFGTGMDTSPTSPDT